MTVSEFFYWLQGYFEISGTVAPLTDEQLECIDRHDRIVSATQPGGRGENMIKIAVLAQSIRDGITDRECGTAAIRKIVAAQFEHVIDPQAGGPAVQDSLNKIHHPPHQIGGVDPKTGAVYRC